MNNFQEQFKQFILNDIFWFNKSELNFGIYKIFRQKEKFIRGKLNEIVENIEKQLSSSNEDEFERLKEKIFEYIPPKKAKDIEINSLEALKNTIKIYANGDTDDLLSELDALNSEKKYDSTKVYEYLYQFFNLYYEKGDFGYTPRSFRTYTIPYVHEEYLSTPEKKNACESSANIDYRGEETLFTWKTKDSYYIKSNKFLNSVTLNLTYNKQDYAINTNIIDKDEDIKDDKKVKQYRLVSIKKDGNTISLNFNISDHATPKHTIYLSMLSVIKNDIKELNYHTIFEDKKLKEYFEKLPFEDKPIQTSLLDEEQQKLQLSFKELIEDENIFNHLFITSKSKGVTKVSNIFNCELSGTEDEMQLKSKTSKLMISKKDYASKVYTKTTAKVFLELDKKEKFEIDSKNDYEKLYEKDDLLNFFYRLDRGINLFYAGVDSDYFIHKNLKRFLSVELDKFIKNYIFADTDAILLMNKSAKKIATFARVFKEQANIFIDLLSSIEEFQKYIWEKRKMVKSSYYIISSNKIEDENLLEVVLNNRNQIEEWEELGIIKKLKKPNILELQSHSYPIDTKHFDDVFKYQVLSQFENIEEEVSGLLIKSENYQALKFLEPKYTDKQGDGKIKCVYIDPPYNTGNDGFVYKDSFKSASWLSMMNDRLEVARKLMREDGVIFTSIDDNEVNNLHTLNKQVFGHENFISNVTILANKGGQDYLRLSKVHEYLLVYSKTIKSKLFNLQKENVKLNFEDSYGKYQLRELRNRNPKFNKENRPNLYFPIYINPNDKDKYGFCSISLEKNKKYNIEVFPLNKKGNSSVWRWSKDKILKENIHVSAKQKKDGNWNINEKYRKITEKAKSVWDESSVSTESGTKAVRNLFDKDLFSHPKPPKLIEKVANLTLDNQVLLDYFAGSGTSFHSIININNLTNLYNEIDETITLLENEKEKKLTENKFLKLLEAINTVLDNIVNLSFNYNSIDGVIDILSDCIDEDDKGNKKVNPDIDFKDKLKDILELLKAFSKEFEINSFNDYKMNKYIGIEFGEYFDSTTVDRIKKLLYSTYWEDGKSKNKYGYSTIVQYIELEQYDDIIDNLKALKDIDYSKVPFGYIYEPDKNQINFRMENELNDPFSQDARFDLFTSLLFHEGLELQTITLEDDILVATVKDKYEKMCAVVLGSDKSKIESKVNSIKDDYSKIYANIQSPQVESIIAETFKGK